MRAILVFLLLACLAAAQKNRGNRPKPSERDRQERQKDLFWFKVGDEDTEACKEVDEAAVEIVPGAPGDSCKVSKCSQHITNANSKMQLNSVLYPIHFHIIKNTCRYLISCRRMKRDFVSAARREPRKPPTGSLFVERESIYYK